MGCLRGWGDSVQERKVVCRCQGFYANAVSLLTLSTKPLENPATSLLALASICTMGCFPAFTVYQDFFLLVNWTPPGLSLIALSLGTFQKHPCHN